MMGQFSMRSPDHLTQWILPEFACNLSTLKVSDIRGFVPFALDTKVQSLNLQNSYFIIA